MVPPLGVGRGLSPPPSKGISQFSRVPGKEGGWSLWLSAGHVPCCAHLPWRGSRPGLQPVYGKKGTLFMRLALWEGHKATWGTLSNVHALGPRDSYLLLGVCPLERPVWPTCAKYMGTLNGVLSVKQTELASRGRARPHRIMPPSY